jgi:hypothetical protein
MSPLCIWVLPFTKNYGLAEEKIRNPSNIKLSSLLDICAPWVLAPDGTLLIFFDWVPIHLCVGGPWNVLALPTIVLVVATACYFHPFTMSSNNCSTPRRRISSACTI